MNRLTCFKQRIYIGNWNMILEDTHIIPYNTVFKHVNIVNIQIVIIGDNGHEYFSINDSNVFISYFDNNFIVIARFLNKCFHNFNFSKTNLNRGYLNIYYDNIDFNIFEEIEEYNGFIINEV